MTTSAGRRFGPYLLAPGITGANALVLLYSTFSTIGLVTFLNFANPYVFALLGIPEDRQGALASALIFLQEGLQVACGAAIGALADRRGRQRALVTGLVLLAAGFAAYPFAESVVQLLGLRVFYAIGQTAATVMISTLIAEYIDNTTRGRWMGTVGICNGVGVVLTALVLTRIPIALTGAGFSQTSALRMSFVGLACYLLLLAWLASRGLREPPRTAPSPSSGLWQQTLDGLAIARGQPRIALAYATAFASRADLVIITTFMSLWIGNAAMAAGMTPAQAAGKAGMMFGLAQGVALLWSFVMGLILDRIPRLSGMVLAFSLGAVGYFLLGSVDDPLGRLMIPAAIAAGIGEASAVVAAGVLIGQEAPAAQRGVVIGTFATFGSIGMVALTVVGGQVFDQIGGGAPFLMMAGVNLAVAGLALAVRNRDAAAARTRTAPAG